MMRILVDADACPVKHEIVKIAKVYQIPVLLFFDTSHVYHDGYSEVITIDQGRDMVDFALINRVNPGDLVITQDYGVASMALAKQAHCINQNGLIYTPDNIDALLHSRYENQKLRSANIRVKGPKKRREEDNHHFEEKFIHLLKQILEVNYE
jgi:uncharacterized protein